MNSKWGNSLAIVARNVRSVWRANPSGLFGGLYTDAPRGGVSSRGIILLRGRAPRLAPARPPDELLA